jgi:hypothetical protein
MTALIQIRKDGSMRVNKVILPVLIGIAIVFLISACANIRSIEDTIQQFQDAANAQDFDSFKDTLSEASDFWPTGDPAIQDFLETYLGTFIPLTYTVTSIQETSSVDATVDAQSNYFGLSSVTVQFIMRKHDKVWKVRQYWDDVGGSLDVIWQKIGDMVPLEE